MTPVEKIVSLTNYVNSLKNRLSSPPNEKHKNHPEALKAYLSLEVKKAERTLENLSPKGSMAKLRKLGDILLDMEPLLDELVEKHELQMGDVIALVVRHLEMHNPSCIEEFADNTRPVLFYGHKDLTPKKETKYPL